MGVSEQFALFETPASLPEGLRYGADLVSPETEQQLVSRIRDLPLEPFQFGQFEGKRRVASFGFRYDYASRQLQPYEPNHPPLIHEPLPFRPARWGGPTPITHLIRGIQIPIVNAAPPTSPSRGFLPWRFAYAGPRCAPRHLHGAAIRKPSQFRTHAPQQSIFNQLDG
jgi:hypothetical protein